MQSSRCLLCHELTHTCDLERSLFDRFTQRLKICTTHALQCLSHNTGSTDTYIDDRIGLRHTVKCTCHERIIIRCITKYNQFRAAIYFCILGRLRSRSDHLTHQTDCIHIDTGLCRSHIDRTADEICLCECLWYRTDQKFFSTCHALAHQCRITTEEIHTDLLSRTIKCLCDCNIVLRCLAGC